MCIANFLMSFTDLKPDWIFRNHIVIRTLYYVVRAEHFLQSQTKREFTKKMLKLCMQTYDRQADAPLYFFRIALGSNPNLYSSNGTEQKRSMLHNILA